MKKLYSCAELSLIDEIAQKDYGIPSLILMENAGRDAFRCLNEMMKPGETPYLLFLIGKGNNGGDAMVMARLALEKGWAHQIFLMSRENLSPALNTQIDIYKRCGGDFSPIDQIQDSYTHVIDGMLGSGLRGPLREKAAKIIDTVNSISGIKIALDLPSGLGDQYTEGLFFHADITLTMGGNKRILYHPMVQPYRGKVILCDPGFPSKLLNSSSIQGYLLEKEDELELPFSPFDHKGNRGHLGVFAGSDKMPGAAELVCRSANHMGVGLLSLLTSPEENIPIKNSCVLFKDWDDLDAVSLTAAALGPGWGRGSNKQYILSEVLNREIPAVVDADGLWHLHKLNLPKDRTSPFIITPHPKEAAFLLGWTTQDVLKKPWEAIISLQRIFGCTVVLKGSLTWISSPDKIPVVLDSPNPFLARGGSGDLLTGIIGVVLAWGFQAYEAAWYGVKIHSEASRRAAEEKGFFQMEEIGAYISKYIGGQFGRT